MLAGPSALVALLQARILDEALSPSYGRALVSAFRGVLRAAWRRGLIDGPAWDRIQDVAPIRGESAPQGRSLFASEVRSLFEAARTGNPVIAARDVALLAILLGAGLRRAEVAALDLGDFEARLLVVRRGNGNRGRSVPVGPDVEHAIQAWLAVRGDVPGPLICRVRCGGQLSLDRLRDRAVWDRLQHLCRKAEVPRADAHSCLRTLITGLLDAGTSLPAIQRISGHRKVSVLMGQDRSDERAADAAAARISLPI